MSDYLEQSPYNPTINPFYGNPEFAENPEPRCPCLLLLDTSTSMNGRPISELNSALIAFKEELMSDSLAAKRVEIGVISFGPVRIDVPFQTVDEFSVPTLQARGDTPMGAAIERAVALLRERKDTYKSNGIAYYRPWIFLITDGSPTDSWHQAAEQIRAGEAEKAFVFYAVGVEGANFSVLKQISVREPLRLVGLRFRELFVWLSGSLQRVSGSTPGDIVPLQNPVTPGGWAAIE